MNEHVLTRMQELRDLAGIVGLASWDQETYLPKKADPARASQLATLQGLYHERLIDPRLGEWLADAQPTTDDEAAMVRVLARERDRALNIPSRLVKALAEAQSQALSAWREARAKKDFPAFRPFLETLVALRREQADAWGHHGERYDALLESYEPGMRVARLLPVLNRLKDKLVPIVEKLDALAPPRSVLAGKTFDIEQQWAFTMQLLPAMGFDLEAGRQDRSVHPFTSNTHQLDVRLTTRLSAELPFSALFGTLHEGGHGLYEQGFLPEHARTTLSQAPSMGLHESQSRLWENLVGRSQPFWQHWFPRLQQTFPAQLGEVTLEQLMREVNRVQRSFIRVEADEVTYNLHIVLRTELELELLRGTLQAADLDEAWNAKTKALLGLTVPSSDLGVLQDIHWAYGEFGYFPTYALGNLYAASLWKALRRALPDVDAELAKGNSRPILEWLRHHVHQQGFRFDAETVVTRATGAGLTDVDFIEAITTRYGGLYGISF
jgi:carboxypeptidase Taq